jgi:hypothetical protein
VMEYLVEQAEEMQALLASDAEVLT